MQVSGNTLRMQLNDYRGLSAYEVAVENGFVGTEAEWLASLKGEKGADGNLITVNHKKSVDGNISVNATDIYMYPGMQDETVEQAVVSIRGSITATNAAKAEALAQVVSLPLASWAQDGEIYTQTVAVNRVTADAARTCVVVSPSTDRSLEAEYNTCEVRASAQGDNAVTFTCKDLPEIDLEANVMIVVLSGSEAEEVSVE